MGLSLTLPVRLHLTALVATVVATLTVSGRAEPVSFNRDVRPILSDKCFACHGPSAADRQSGLRLDQAESAQAQLESGAHAIVPGDLTASELVARITATDATVRMPPVEFGKPLTAPEIATLQRWVSEGGVYAGHWAFERVERPDIPVLSDNGWARNPIDHLILKKLQAAGLTPSAEADKATLIRRITLDLTGLPPTLPEVEQFLADNSPAAYEKVVDRLLQSPHYGERMALPWLDYARYADSNGFQSDGSRDIWGWRNWVIEAYNRNLPFDHFTIEQLAGDMLPEPTRDQLIATGFNRNHRLNGEGGRIVEEWFVETVIDRVETTGLTWLGLTFNCCRCHDHKYDPISQREFYQMFAYFNSVDESGVLSPAGKNGENTPPLLSIASPEQTAELAALQTAVAQAEVTQQEVARQLPDLLQAWETEFVTKLATEGETWEPLSTAEAKSLGGATLERQADGTFLASGTNPDFDSYEVASKITGQQLTGFLLECLPDASLPEQSVGRYPNGNFVVTRVEAEVRTAATTEPVPLKFSRIEANYSQKGWDIALLNNGNRAKGWAVDGPTRKEICKALFVLEQPQTFSGEATLTVRIYHEAIAKHNIGRFRLLSSSHPTELLSLNGNNIPATVRQALMIPAEQRNSDQLKAIEAFYVEQVPNPLLAARQAASAAKQRATDFQDLLPTTMVMREVAPRTAFILNRGEYDQPRDAVERALPKALPPLPAGEPNDRLGLARWIVSRENPLTARVWVNRMWEQLFGVGIVKTSENFGSQAEYPTHPELLDWLAVEFMEPANSPAVNGIAPQPWDMKAFIKLVVMSATYRQSSQVTPEQLRLDPENRLLARGPRVRLKGEFIRDQALAVSGLLVPQQGGPSVRPYMPAGVWDETSKYGNLRNYQHEPGDGLYRRSLYTIWKRTAAPPSMLIFDAPNREVCTIKRSRTNTPLQALSLLNEITFVEAARNLAVRMIREGGNTPEERLAYGFRLALTRTPTTTELAVLHSGWSEDLTRFRANPESAAKLVTFGESKPPSEMSVDELAAYTLVANVLFNLDEFVTRE